MTVARNYVEQKLRQDTSLEEHYEFILCHVIEEFPIMCSFPYFLFESEGGVNPKYIDLNGIDIGMEFTSIDSIRLLNDLCFFFIAFTRCI